MADAIKVVLKTSEIDPRRQPPDSELLRQIKDRFSSNADKETNQLLRSPDSILQPMNRAQKYLQKLPFAPNKAIWHFINYLVQYGGLIMTDDPTRRYFFDADQLDEIIRAGQRREVPNLKHAGQSRLTSFLAKTEKSGATARPLSATEIKALVTGDMFDLLKNLAEEHPEIEGLIQSLGNTVEICCAAEPKKTQEAIAALALFLDESLRRIISRVESQALELVAATTTNAASASEKRAADFHLRLIDLSGETAKLQAQLDRLRREQNLIEHYLLDVKQHVLEEELKPRLNFAEAEDLKKIELAIERAHAKADELNEYIGKLLAMQAPIDNRIRELQRLQSALKICAASQGKTLSALPTGNIPARPAYDQDELLNWQNISLPDELESTVITDLSAFTPDEKLLIAAFQVLGRKTSTGKMAHALCAIGLADAQRKREHELRNVCRSLSEKEPPPIRYAGSVARCAIYMHSGSVVIGNVNAIITANKQVELLAMFQKPTPEPETGD